MVSRTLLILAATALLSSGALYGVASYQYRPVRHDGIPYVAREVEVSFKPGVTQEEAESILSQPGLHFRPSSLKTTRSFQRCIIHADRTKEPDVKDVVRTLRDSKVFDEGTLQKDPISYEFELYGKGLARASSAVVTAEDREKLALSAISLECDAPVQPRITVKPVLVPRGQEFVWAGRFMANEKVESAILKSLGPGDSNRVPVP